MGERKSIAIIGGGASGLICSYLLSDKYDITLYEKNSMLGGNVQTLNKNVKSTALPDHINIENGVLGFSQSYYPNFHKLLHHLKVDYHTYKPSVSLFSDHQFYPAKKTSYLNLNILTSIIKNIRFRSDLFQLQESKQHFKKQIKNSKEKSLSFKDFNFSQDLYKTFMQSLFMLSFSTPYDVVRQLPQSLLNQYFLSLPDSTWSFIEGGVYAYMEAMIQKTKMQVFCNAKHIRILRNKNSVTLNIEGINSVYDIVVIATTPGSVKGLLSDMTENESHIFHDFEDQAFRTIAHKDLSFYKTYKSVDKTPMDLFYKYNSEDVGYNTYLNKVYKLKTKNHYSFAYNLEDQIERSSILHEANHVVPKYNLKHDDKIELLQRINGDNNTYYAGAYTDNGLHEGAVNSALKVSKLLGGLVF